MKRNDSTDLAQVLATLNEIATSINRLGVGQDLSATLNLIAHEAVRLMAGGSPTGDDAPSVVIWVFDEPGHSFDAAQRVAAGEPRGASAADRPRPDGMGARAVRAKRRLLSYETGAPAIHPAKREAGAQVLACYPLLVGSDVAGVLYLYRCSARRFSVVELLLLDNFVQLAAMAIHYGRRVGGLSQALTRKVREMEKLRRASGLLGSRTNLDETLNEILAIGLDLTAAQYGSFEWFDRRRNLLVTKALAGSLEQPASEPSLTVNEQSVVGWVALHKTSLRLGNLAEPPWRDIYHPLPIEREMRSELAVPIIGAGGGLEGVLNIESPQLDAFSAEDQLLLEALAGQAVVAIQEIRLLDALQEIVQVLLTADYDELLRLIIERACDLIHVSDGSIWLVQAEDDTLLLRQSTDTVRIGETLSLRNSFTGQAVRLRQPVTIDDIRFEPKFMHPEMAEQRGWVSAIVVPLLAAQDNAHPVGSFALYSRELRDFSDWDKKLLTCLANHAAVAIRDAEQLRLLKQAQERQATAETIAAVGDVAANLLHQLNNKFGAISVRVQGIEAKSANTLAADAYLANNLREIAQSTRQAMAIVRDSMAPLQPIRAESVNLARCIEQALARAALPATIAVRQQNLRKLPPVVAGEKQLEMVFYNLIDNARNAMDGAGELHLSGRVDNGFAVITVADSGPGIAAERQAAIFEFAGSADERPGTERLRFGLWWVKTFVDRFGGRVEVDSRPGRGARFSVWLPTDPGIEP